MMTKYITDKLDKMLCTQVSIIYTYFDNPILWESIDYLKSKGAREIDCSSDDSGYLPESGTDVVIFSHFITYPYLKEMIESATDLNIVPNKQTIFIVDNFYMFSRFHNNMVEYELLDLTKKEFLEYVDTAPPYKEYIRHRILLYNVTKYNDNFYPWSIIEMLEYIILKVLNKKQVFNEDNEIVYPTRIMMSFPIGYKENNPKEVFLKDCENILLNYFIRDIDTYKETRDELREIDKVDKYDFRKKFEILSTRLDDVIAIKSLTCFTDRYIA